MHESKRLELANTVMRILDNRPRDNPKLTDHKLLHIVRNEGDNTIQLSTIHDAVTYLEDKGAVFVERYGGTRTSAFDFVKISKIGIAKLYENGDWPKPAPSPKPKYHCKKCDAIVNPSDEKCPNGHDLSIVGKMIKLTLTDGLTLSDSIDLTDKFVIKNIENRVKDLELGPKTPESQEFIEVLNVISDILNEQRREIKEEFEKDRASVPFSREKGIIIFVLGVISTIIIERIIFSML